MPQSTDLLLIMQTLALKPVHGSGVAQRIQQLSKDVLQVEQVRIIRRYIALAGSRRRPDDL
jgi:hypothetical protein